MDEAPLSGRDVILAFGTKEDRAADRIGSGLTVLHELLGCSRKTIEQWSRNGVPPRYWHLIVPEAKRRRIRAVTYEALEETARVSAELAAAKARAAAMAQARQARRASSRQQHQAA